MSNGIHQPNSDGKFEFALDAGIKKNFIPKNDLAFQFALNVFKSFRNTFGVVDEICVVEADIDTFVALLTGLLDDYDKFNGDYTFYKNQP